MNDNCKKILYMAYKFTANKCLLASIFFLFNDSTQNNWKFKNYRNFKIVWFLIQSYKYPDFRSWTNLKIISQIKKR